MEFTIAKDGFLSAISFVSPFAGRNKSVLSLDNVRLTIKGDKYKMESCDGGNAARIYGDVEKRDSDLQIAFNPEDIGKYLKLTTDEFASFQVDMEQHSMTIKHTGGEAKSPIFETDGFPNVFNGSKAKICGLDCRMLNEWIADCKNFAATDDLRPVLCGIYLYKRADDGEIGCCATDTRTLIHKYASDSEIPDFGIIIPNGVIRPLTNMLTLSEGIVEIYKMEHSSMMFSINGLSVLFTEQTGVFPNFKSIIPKDRCSLTEVRKDDLMQAISRIKTSSPVSGLVKMEVQDGYLTMTSEDLDLSKSTTERMRCNSNGNLSIGFNCKYLMKCASAIHGEKVFIATKDERSPAILSGQETPDGTLVLIVPMLLN